VDRFEAMNAFVKVVDSGSLSAAARLSSRSLTAMSRLISGLENGLGTQLLRRTTRSLALTEEGRLFYDRAKVILAEVEDLGLALSSRQAEPSGRLRVSAPLLIGRELLAPMVSRFLARHPAVAVDLLLVDRAVSLIEEDIHVALRVGHLPDSDLVARKIGDIDLVVCAAPGYIERRGMPSVPAELKQHDCLVFSDVAGPIDWQFQVEGKRQVVRVLGRLWANSLDAVVSAAKDGVGIVRVPSWYVADDLRVGRLKLLLGDHQRDATPVQLMFSRSRLTSPAVRAFVAQIADDWSRQALKKNERRPSTRRALG
jgi:DNA-binding transcriptional LysR family regulator